MGPKQSFTPSVTFKEANLTSTLTPNRRLASSVPNAKFTIAKLTLNEGAISDVSDVGLGCFLLDGLHGSGHTLSRGMPPFRLLIVEDDAPLRKVCCEIAGGMGFVTLSAGSVPEAMDTLNEQQPMDMLLVDIRLPGGGGVALLSEVKALYPNTVVVMMTSFATVSSAVQAMRMGADDYLTKPFALSELTAVLHRSTRSLYYDIESRMLRERLRTKRGMANLVGTSLAMEKVYRILSKAALSPYPVLISGECGTGKRLVAHTIHRSGRDAAKPFIAIDCGSLAPALLESDLFGHVQDPITGVDQLKEGLLSGADGGTVLLDEIGDMPLSLQSKLHRALQEKKVRPVGATHSVPITTRVLAATNRDLLAMVGQGQFRRDLYFRLNVVSLTVPSLRAHREDIAVLTEHFLEQVRGCFEPTPSFSQEAMRLMNEYDWPGNVRELRSAIERSFATSSGPMLQLVDIPRQTQHIREHGLRTHAIESPVDDLSLAGHERSDVGIVFIADMEKQAIIKTIRQFNGDKLAAARALGIGKTTLYRKLKDYHLPEARNVRMAENL